MARETQRSPADEKKLEQYGVWVKVKPRDVTPPLLDESFELSDLEAPKTAGRSETRAAEISSGGSTLTAEEEELLDELETELEPSGGSSGVSVPEEEPLLSDAELPDIESAARTGSSDLELETSDEELPELEEGLEAAPRAPSGRAKAAEPAEVEVTLSEDVSEEEQFDDLAALESELATVGTKARDVSGSSAEILSRIEDELRSIRADLNQLRSDLSGLRKTAAAAGSAAARPAAGAGVKGGFLDEDEDETIALTGDELDNILNTAEITEEAAEASERGGDILSFDSPEPEAVEAPVAEEELEAVESGLTDGEITDETLVLADEDLLATSPEETPPAVQGAEELPSELVLEELAVEEEAPAASSELPEIDLEGIPEIETEPPARKDSASEDESETIDLETLDLGEEPKVINAVPEQVEDLTELPEAEEVLEAEEISKAGGPIRGAEELPEVDLEALAAEAESLEDEVPTAPTVEDLEVSELEAVPEDGGFGPVPDKEIEISFDSDLAQDAEALKEAEPAEEIPEAEEVAEEAAAATAADESAGIPDNLKEEIRTVLKYMDHLLEALPDEKIQEFASSDYFVMYKKLFEDLGLGE
jgi:pilus assembly protein FimV